MSKNSSQSEIQNNSEIINSNIVYHLINYFSQSIVNNFFDKLNNIFINNTHQHTSLHNNNNDKKSFIKADYKNKDINCIDIGNRYASYKKKVKEIMKTDKDDKNEIAENYLKNRKKEINFILLSKRIYRSKDTNKNKQEINLQKVEDNNHVKHTKKKIISREN